MSKEPAIIDAEFREVATTKPTEEQVLDIVRKWLERYHGIPREMLYLSESNDGYAFTRIVKRQIAAAALELMGEIELAHKISREEPR